MLARAVRAARIASVLCSAGPLAARDLCDFLAGISERGDQAAGKAAGALQCPQPQAGCLLPCPGQQPLIARAVGAAGDMGPDTASCGIDDGQVDAVPVRVAPDHIVIVLCQRHAGYPFRTASGKRPGGTREITAAL